MSEPTPGEPPRLFPMLPTDPPKVGDFWLDSRLTAAASGVAFVAHDQANTPAMVLLLSEGAAADAGARDRFAGAVNQLHIDTVLARGGQGQDTGRLAQRFRAEPDDPQLGADTPATPWVALAYDASPGSLAEADRLLAEVDLSRLGQQGWPVGPDYRLHWIDRVRPGLAKVWPLPWPGRHERAGWLSILASWLLMLLICALAILLAILIFQQSSTQQPPPPVPPTATPPPTSASAPPPSGSPSPQTGSPSPQSASPSNGQTSARASASPSPGSGSPSPASASPSGAGPSQNSRL